MGDPSREDLSAQIAAAKARHGMAEKSDKEQEGGAISAGGMALRYGAEFGSAVFVSILIGLGIDHIFATAPWGLLVLLAFGLAAGILGVIRAYQRLTAQFAVGKDGADAPDEGNQG